MFTRLQGLPCIKNKKTINQLKHCSCINRLENSQFKNLLLF